MKLLCDGLALVEYLNASAEGFEVVEGVVWEESEAIILERARGDDEILAKNLSVAEKASFSTQT